MGGAGGAAGGGRADPAAEEAGAGAARGEGEAKGGEQGEGVAVSSDLRQPEAQEDDPEAAEAHSEGRHHRPEASAGSREQETQKVMWSGLYIDCRGLCCRSIVWVLFVKSC